MNSLQQYINDVKKDFVPGAIVMYRNNGRKRFVEIVKVTRRNGNDFIVRDLKSGEESTMNIKKDHLELSTRKEFEKYVKLRKQVQKDSLRKPGERVNNPEASTQDKGYHSLGY